jgi:hypothetical protein
MVIPPGYAEGDAEIAIAAPIGDSSPRRARVWPE